MSLVDVMCMVAVFTVVMTMLTVVMTIVVMVVAIMMMAVSVIMTIVVQQVFPMDHAIPLIDHDTLLPNQV